jgi:hypothetical protein
MSARRIPQTDALYDDGLKAMQAGRWEEAVQAFSTLRQISTAYPEAENFLADAQLKLDMSRARIPDAVVRPPPAERKLSPAILFVPLMIGVLLCGIGGLYWAFFLRNDASSGETVAAPTVQATAETAATAAPAPTPTTPVVDLGTGTLRVAVAEGAELPVRTAQNVEIVLDASGSMLASVGGRRKIDIAHESLAVLVGNLPDSAQVALRTYGRNRADDCDDTELVQPLGPLDREQLIGQINGIRPINLSRSPIGRTFEQIGETLAEREGDTLLLLVSDGDETCGGDPASVAQGLREQYPGLRVNVVGFNVGEATWQELLKNTATKGGGAYFDATNAAQLASALLQAIAPPFIVRDASGNEVARGSLGGEVQLAVGSYTVEIADAAPVQVEAVAVQVDGITTVRVSGSGGVLSAEVAP